MKVLEGVKVIRSLVLSGIKSTSSSMILKRARKRSERFSGTKNGDPGSRGGPTTLEDAFVSIVQKKQRNNAEL